MGKKHHLWCTLMGDMSSLNCYLLILPWVIREKVSCKEFLIPVYLRYQEAVTDYSVSTHQEEALRVSGMKPVRQDRVSHPVLLLWYVWQVPESIWVFAPMVFLSGFALSRGYSRQASAPCSPSQGYENSFLADAFLAKQSKFWQPQYLDILSKILEQLCSVEKGGVSHVTKYQWGCKDIWCDARDYQGVGEQRLS